jgi:Peptidase inhibitor I9
MRFNIRNIATLAALLLPVVFSAPVAPDANLKIRNAGATDVIPNSYIVVYKDGVSAAEIAAHESAVSSTIGKQESPMSGIGSKWDMETFKGYQIEADAATIQQIADSPVVSSSMLGIGK